VAYIFGHHVHQSQFLNVITPEDNLPH